MNPVDPTPLPPEEPWTDFGLLSPAECPVHTPEHDAAMSGAEGAPRLPEHRTADGGVEDELRDPDLATAAASPTAAEELADWKSRLRYDFERWLCSLSEIPPCSEADEAADEPPDLYAFFEQLAILNTESRRSNRRTAEALSQWGEALLRFGADLDRVRELATQTLSRGNAERLSRAHCLALVELLDRLQRLTAAFAQTPPRRWFGRDRAWRQAWETHRQAFRIVTDHFEALLREEGVTALDTFGQPFDPQRMSALAVEATDRRPPQTVLEEVTRGYLWNGELLRPAQVRIAVPRPNP